MGYRKADKEGFNKLMRTLRKLSFDEIIETHQDTEIAYKAYGKDNSLRLIQDSYVGSTGEAMIIRKLRNIAIRNFPKNFDTTVIESLYRETFEEKYDKDVVQPIVAPSVQIETKQDDIVSKLQKETETTLKEEVVIQDDIDKDLEGLV
jgi:hypothetical protein